MRNRRSRRRNNNSDLLNTLHLISKFLMVLIVIVFILFINSIVLRNEKMAKNDINLSESETSSNLPEKDQNIVSDQINNTENINSKSNTPIKKSATINMAFTGDIMCHNTIYKDAFDSSNNSYDFSYIFDDVKYNIQTADIALGNLETTFAGSSKG